MLTVQTLPRKFKIGATVLADPNPIGTLKECHAILAQQFPLLRHTTIFEEDARLSACNTYIEYEIQLPPVKVQG